MFVSIQLIKLERAHVSPVFSNNIVGGWVEDGRTCLMVEMYTYQLARDRVQAAAKPTS